MEGSLYKNLDTSLISDYNPEYEIGLKGELTGRDLSERFLGFRIHGRGMEGSLYKNLDTSLISDYNPEYEIGLKGEDDI